MENNQSIKQQKFLAGEAFKYNGYPCQFTPIKEYDFGRVTGFGHPRGAVVNKVTAEYFSYNIGGGDVKILFKNCQF